MSVMDQKTYDKGLEVRRAVLGKEYVDNSLRNADEFNKPFQELITEYCWGAVWGREELPRKTRSILNIAMLSILNRPHELRIHLQGASRSMPASLAPLTPSVWRARSWERTSRRVERRRPTCSHGAVYSKLGAIL